MVQYLVWDGFDPYFNLALERYLLDNTAPDTCTLLLWQNSNTVVIGCNQNPWKECRTGLLQEEQVHLARRFSGGGAVYHDLGNLNFSFICPERLYDQQKHFSVIASACHAVGIDVVASGRNDLLADGKKFSGNAFFHQNGTACHHGTLLISSDYGKLSRYLTPSKAKLAGKGVDSVRSRVTNLQAICPSLTVDNMKAHLLEAFEEIYGQTASALTLPQEALDTIRSTAAFLKSPQWLYGKHPPATCSLEGQFSWGGICISFGIEEGYISQVCVYTDSLDWQLSQNIEATLLGQPFQKSALLHALADKVEETVLRDLITMIDI